jgi:hypothetical protein
VVVAIGVSHGRHRERGRLVGVAAGHGCVSFLWTYAVVHLAHERGFDLAAVRITPIPLFSTLLWGLAAAAATASAVPLIVLATGRRLRSMPRLLVASIALYGAIMVLFP